MSIRLGGELEFKDVEIKASSLEARLSFLELLWQMKPKLVADLLRLFTFESLPLEIRGFEESDKSVKKEFLFYLKNNSFHSSEFARCDFRINTQQTPVLAFFEYFSQNQSEFEKLVEDDKKNSSKGLMHSNQESEEYPLINFTPNATDFIPNWKTLRSKPNSEKLCSSLTVWADKWNLNSEWCLDFALIVLKNFKIDLDDLSLTEEFFETDSALDFDSYEEFIKDGSAWRQALLDLRVENATTKYTTPIKLPKYPEFKFVFQQKIDGKQKKIFELKEIWKPMILNKEEFKEKVEIQLWQNFMRYFSSKSFLLAGQVSEVSKKLSEFSKALNNYISLVKSKFSDIASETIEKKRGENHLRWLINYQIPEVKNYTDLAKKEKLDRKSIKGGIKSVADLIGLNLRKSQYNGRRKIL